MICSRCRCDLPATDFAPQRWTMLTKYVKSKQCLIRYRKKHKRGRRYDCNACRRERRAEKRAASELEKQRRWQATLDAVRSRA